jgi:hypothetical protein
MSAFTYAEYLNSSGLANMAKKDSLIKAIGREIEDGF